MRKLDKQHDSDFKAINLACGGNLCNQLGWVNADHSPSTRDVMKVNLLKPLPFHENTFDIVYHSQFIEHLSMGQAGGFLKECFRVLKPNGVLRVVTPDLKNQASEYLKNLDEILRSPHNKEIKLRYDWIRLEMLDQLTRQRTGGDMVSFLSQSGLKSQKYLRERLGVSGDQMIPLSDTIQGSGVLQSFGEYLRYFRNGFKRMVNRFIPKSIRVGKFRLSGEVHLCMYDQYLLSSMLADSCFSNIKCVNAYESRIENWAATVLDLDEHGHPDCPASL